MTSPRLALLDMNNGQMNRSIKAISILASEIGFTDIDVFDVRQKNELPLIIDYNVFVSSGGPGDPREKGVWGKNFENLIDAIRDHNAAYPATAKYLFLICHSFQMASAHWGLGEIEKREDGFLSGIHPQIVPDTAKAIADPVIRSLSSPLYVLESRFYRVRSDPDSFSHPFVLFAMRREEKNTVSLTGFATRDGNIIGTQFHPEVNVEHIREFLTSENETETQDKIRQLHGASALEEMRDHILYTDASHQIFREFLLRAAVAS